MTGIKITWHFNDKQGNELKSLPTVKKFIDQRNIQFSKMINLVHFSNNTETFEIIKHVRGNIVKSAQILQPNCDASNILLESEMMETVINTVLNLTAKSIDNEVRYNLSKEELEKCASQFFYLANCPNSNLVVFGSFLKKLFVEYSKPMVLGSLGKLHAELIKKNLLSEGKVVSFFVQNISTQLSLAHQDLAILNVGSSSFPSTKRNFDSLKNRHVQTITNHPVHILNESNSFSPSAFIPFCDLGGNMEVVGSSHKEFPIPVCNAFDNTILNNQLCYKINVNDFIKRAEYDGQQKINLNLFLDYNEEKQYMVQKREILVNSSLSMSRNLISSKNKGNINEAMIYFGTLGKYSILLHCFKVHLKSLLLGPS